MDTPAVTVVVPTRGRSAYLEVTLDSLLRQRTRTPHEILVVDDGSTDATREVAERAGVRCVSHGERRSLNAARNTGIRAAGAPLVALVDDDVVAPPGWLDALARGAERNPDAEAFGGPIRARFEGGGPRSCGREDPPVTTLDLGPDDREAEMVWGANLAVRRSAVERVGWFDELIVRPHGDEEEWLERLRAAGGRIVYLADAGLDHRRTASDSRLAPLARAARAGERPSPRPRPRLGRGAAGADRLRVAHAAARLPAGGDHGGALGGPNRGGAAHAGRNPRGTRQLSLRRRRRREGALAARQADPGRGRLRPGGPRGPHPTGGRPPGGAPTAAPRARAGRVPARLADCQRRPGPHLGTSPRAHRARLDARARPAAGGPDGRDGTHGREVRELEPPAGRTRRRQRSRLDAHRRRRRRAPRPVPRSLRRALRGV